MTGKILSTFALLIFLGTGGYVYLTDTTSTLPDVVVVPNEVLEIDTPDTSSVVFNDDRDEEEDENESEDGLESDREGTGQASSGSTATAPTPTPSIDTSPYTLATVATHNSVSSCWSVINGKVYDLTKWINQHPGGERAITGICGKDGSSVFNGKHGGQNQAASVLSSFYLGVLK